MRVLHVNKYLYRRGGAEAYMQDVALLQQQAGHEVAFFGMRHPENPPLPFVEHFPAQLEFEPAPAGPVGKARLVGRMLWSTSARGGIAAVIGSFRPDVVHLHNIYHQLSPSILGPVKGAGLPAVMTVHDFKLVCPSYQFLDKGRVCEACLGGHFTQAVRRRCKDDSLAASALLAAETALHSATRAYRGVDVFICPSKFLRGKLVQGAIYPERLHLLPNFVDARDTPVKRHPGGPVVFAGRLAPEKGVDTLVQAMAHLPDATLEIAGDGPQRADVEQLATEVAPGRVTFHGRLAKADVQSLMLRAGVLAVPSRFYENQPMTILEAFSAGLPVVGTAHGGIAELVQEGETGSLAPVDDPRALATALHTVIANPVLAAQMGRRARRLVESDYSPQGHLAGLEQIYTRARSTVVARLAG